MELIAAMAGAVRMIEEQIVRILAFWTYGLANAYIKGLKKII